jgi:glucosamine-phosphate N-acetyltransferase
MISELRSTDTNMGLEELIKEKYKVKDLNIDIYSSLDVMKEQNAVVFKYLINDCIVGIVKCITEKKFITNMGHIEDLYVINAFKNKGIGSKLVEHSINFLSKNNCYKIVLGCDKSLIPFYEKNGFTVGNKCLIEKYYI